MNAAAAALVVLNGRQAFDPRASLFAHNEPGAWYDPSDLSTMFQDSAGTTPVTAVEQAVGLILDKSKGLVLGGDLVTNGTFNTDTTGWTAANSPTLTVGANGVTIQNNGATSGILYQGFTCVAGRSYQASVKITSGGAGFARCEPSNGIPTSVGGNVINASASGTYSFVFVASATTMYIVIGNRNDNNASHTYDNISVREIAGNHAIQPTAASRPILRSRYNLLTYSEDLSNAAWTKRGTFTITANDAVAPDGTLTADKVVGLDAGSNDMFNADYPTVPIALAGKSYIPSVWVKRISTSGSFFIGNPSNSAQGQWDVDLSQLPDAWTRITETTTGVTVVNPFVTVTGGYGGMILRAISGGPLSMHIWGAQQMLANDATALNNRYQRIAAATDYDTVGFPTYLSGDGSDDSMYTGGNLDLSGTDKVTVFAGVTKLSDAGIAIVAELSTSTGIDTGAFYFAAPQNTGASGNFSFKSVGTLNPAAAASATTLAPTSAVLTGIGDITGDNAQLRVDGVVAATQTADQGTGNYGNYPLHIGRRNNASLPFNGRLAQLIVRGATTSAALITQTERWVAGKQGRTL